MPEANTSPRVVRVAIGAVVENVSSIACAKPNTQPDAPPHADAADELRLLITKRATERVLGGLWELPGGKIEPNEHPQDAAVRELREEVGIDIQPLIELPHIEHTYDHATVRLQPYLCRRVQGLPQPLEVDDVRWVALDELGTYRFPDASLPVLDALLEVLRQPSLGDAQPTE